ASEARFGCVWRSEQTRTGHRGFGHRGWRWHHVSTGGHQSVLVSLHRSDHVWIDSGFCVKKTGKILARHVKCEERGCVRTLAYSRWPHPKMHTAVRYEWNLSQVISGGAVVAFWLPDM